MLFLHGYLSSKEAFTAQTRYFSRFYRVTAIDFLGFGESPPLTAPFSVKDYADWLYALMTDLGLKKPHVIAHSFGCRVAVKTAKEYGQVFDKIVLTGAAGVRLPKGLGYKIKVKGYRLCKKIAPRFAERRFGSKEYRTLSPVMKESYKKIVNEDLRGDAMLVTNPVLLLQGDKDKVTPKKEALAYLASFPNAVLKEIDGGHFAFVDSPVPFNLTVEEFLNDDGFPD
ncbi:MAG: alpha/beta hydrolase [Clostridia bacterium]|nr:alpha/beta hydrolase [Clostridia bacterium]